VTHAHENKSQLRNVTLDRKSMPNQSSHELPLRHDCLLACFMLACPSYVTILLNAKLLSSSLSLSLSLSLCFVCKCYRVNKEKTSGSSDLALLPLSSVRYRQERRPSAAACLVVKQPLSVPFALWLAAKLLVSVVWRHRGSIVTEGGSRGRVLLLY
jgi:hypothetical protein